MKNTFFLKLLLILFPFILFSQEEIPFRVQKKMYLKGNSILIGNTILGNHKTEDFDNENESNDAVNMKYIDIDNDDTTFSSSASEILIPETSSEIIYAGLYWSAIYPAEKTIMQRSKREIKYKNKGGRSLDFNTVLIKTAEQPYTAIKGEIIFDADKNEAFKNDSPYSCRADITSYFNKLKNSNGLFTVANIKATQGQPQGGSAGGWLLYIVYRDVTQTPKYFTTYDGFRQINKKGLEIIFDDFQTKVAGSFTSTLVMAAMEGDFKIKTDKCAIFNPETQKFVFIKTPERKPNNFFKSAITTTSNRVPSSKNTLGFDLIKTKLPDGIIANNASQSLIKFSTKADRFYLLFTAFETEIEKAFLSEKNDSVTMVAIKNKEEEGVAKDSVLAVVEKEKNEILIEKPKEELPFVTIPSASPGYTITVTNNGPSDAYNVVVSDPLPPGITTATWNGDNGTRGTGALNDTLATLVNGETVTYTVILSVPSDFSGDLTNIVTVTSDTPDPDPTCIDCTDTNTPAPMADIITLKDDGQTTYTAGEGLVYTITVTNNGPSDAANVVVSDPLPTGIKTATWDGDNGKSGTGALNDTLATLVNGATVTYTVILSVPSYFSGDLTNVVTVISDTPDPDPTCTGCIDTNTPAPMADIVTVKDDGQTTYTAGEDVVYTITVTNNGPSVTSKVTKTKPKKKIKRFTIDGMDSGYYLVTNVFSKSKLAENWTNKLLNLGYNPQSYVNPKNSWIYIYIEKSESLSDLLASKEALRKKDIFKKAWVAGINN
ncbi:MAG: putative repeat protein (TIGR01451 family) [bacterium]